ncbi:tyrosine-protein kinase transmembrane receptor Ror-like [Ornithodoros turicata]|uniref:tyrosine-protein kinase transmembrane receptor Ror-like n=1 Tax=Ornithodoros turicata TaxID=34597 RepID=UPI00313A273E
MCGPEAGCHSYNGSFICICSDLTVKRAHESCAPPALASTGPSSSNNTASQTPTNITFSHQQIARMNRNYTSNGDKNRSSISEELWQQPVGVPKSSAIVLGGAFALGAAILLAVFLLRRKSGRQGAVPPGSLNKCIQQYVANPTYYSSAPETPLHKILHDIEIAADAVVFVEEIGEGCFGKVHKALYTKANGEKEDVAVKVLKDTASSEVQDDLEREVQIMSSFKHENILQLLGVVFAESGSIPWMVFEYMQYGDLAELLRQNAFSRGSASRSALPNLTLGHLPSIAIQIASGMYYLSSQHFVHRDLATRNCLVGDNLSVKISDFGMSRDIYTCDYYKIRGSRMLPVRWMAPESIMYGKFTLESDVWSYGVVLWEIFTFGKQPYYGHSNEEVVKLILQGILLSPPEECPSFICSIMAACWKTEPRDRLQFADIYKRLQENSSSSDDLDVLEEELDSEDYLVPKAAASGLRHQPW